MSVARLLHIFFILKCFLLLMRPFTSACAPKNFEMAQKLQRANQSEQQLTQTAAQRALHTTRPW